MRTRVLITLSFDGLLAFAPTFAKAQQPVSQESVRRPAEKDLSVPIPAHAVIDEIQMLGLYRIPPEAAKSRMSLRPDGEWNAAQLAADVRALNRLGWFEDVTVEAEKSFNATSGGLTFD